MNESYNNEEWDSDFVWKHKISILEILTKNLKSERGKFKQGIWNRVPETSETKLQKINQYQKL